MNERQTQLLLWFAQNLTIEYIGKLLSVSHDTVSRELRDIEKLYPEYYTNALGIRQAGKRYNSGLSNPSSLGYMGGLADQDIQEKF